MKTTLFPFMKLKFVLDPPVVHVEEESIATGLNQQVSDRLGQFFSLFSPFST